LPQLANQVANQAVKGVLGPQVQKVIDAQIARVTAPLLARIDELERRVAALEGRAETPKRAQRSDEI
jgi:hypothetical protein